MIKYIIKETARYLLYLVKRKRYRIKINEDCVSIHKVRQRSKEEYFYGYYDRDPECDGRILFHVMQPDEKSVKIIVKDINDGKETIIAETNAFNWQMGARAIWINADIISYNDFDGEKYICNWFSLSQNRVIKTFGQPLQDFKGGDFYLGVNYQRLRSYAKEYAYYCLPEMNEAEYLDYDHDGIWKVDINNANIDLVLSIAEVLKIEHVDRFDKGCHFLNHIMMSPNGRSFIFIHRYYVSGERYDRLMHYDFKELKVLMDEPMQSHYCWLDENNVFGYGGYQGLSSYNEINVVTAVVTKHIELTKAHPRDGHPTVAGDWICIDDYPDLSRMQPLIVYNRKTKQIKKLGEFFHDLKHKECDRCDLHPRFSDDGEKIYIDTIYTGKRELAYLNVNLKSNE